jgi:hypothetical protein
VLKAKKVFRDAEAKLRQLDSDDFELDEIADRI